MSDRWRKVCPNGHSSWRSRAEDYYCPCCEESFWYLRDINDHDVDRPPRPNSRGIGNGDPDD